MSAVVIGGGKRLPQSWLPLQMVQNNEEQTFGWRPYEDYVVGKVGDLDKPILPPKNTDRSSSYLQSVSSSPACAWGEIAASH